jgi:multidrug efflux pump subunit AcrA (membrane-fusion protein)
VERGATQAAGTPLFQAAGWIEPRPTPIIVSALTDGVIEKLLVVEGQAVQAGEPIAHLIDADAKIALQFAEAELHHHEAEVSQANVAIKAAKTRLEHPVHLEAALAEAAANLAKLETERTNLPFQIRAAEARQVLAKLDWETKSGAGPGAVPARTLAQSQAELATAIANLEELQQRRTSLDREIVALTARRDAVRKQLELKTDEIRQLEEANVSLAIAQSRVHEAQASLAVVRLRIERLAIKAPQAGRVLSLNGRPGKRVSGLDPNSLADMSTVAVLYDPKSLQVRADVPLDQVGKIVPGHPARIETEALPGKALDGGVLQPTGQADIQKNTLQVKVAITEPSPVLKPEMLARVTFLAGAPPADTPKTETLRLFVPRPLIETGPEGSRLWVADASGVARLRHVQPGITARDDLIEIIDGVTATDKLIVSGRDGLQDGVRITISGEDANLGISLGTQHGGMKMERRTTEKK